MSARRLVAIGVFALVVGLALGQAANDRVDDTTPAAIRVFLDAFPWVLVAGGLIVLIAVAAGAGRGRTPKE